MKMRLIRKGDTDGILIQKLLEQMDQSFDVVLVSTGNGEVPAIVTEDGKKYEGYLRSKSFCDQLAMDT